MNEAAKESPPRASIEKSKVEWHRQQAQLPIKEKIRILLELQRQDLELLRRHRALKDYERAWDIEP